MIEMELLAVRVELPSNTPVVLLREKEGDRRALPIFIGTPEATSIAYAVQGVRTPRPMTHDLFGSTLDAVGAALRFVVVTSLVDGTFFADLHISTNGEQRLVSARPSDAIALALRAEVPIYCEDELLDAEGLMLDDNDDAEVGEDGDEPEEIVEEFKEFLSDIRPEDFNQG
jgi:hypothetical protein